MTGIPVGSQHLTGIVQDKFVWDTHKTEHFWHGPHLYETPSSSAGQEEGHLSNQSTLQIQQYKLDLNPMRIYVNP